MRKKNIIKMNDCEFADFVQNLEKLNSYWKISVPMLYTKILF